MAEDEALKLDSLQADLLSSQIQAFLDATSDPAARDIYDALKQAVARHEVPAELTGRLGAIVEVALASGRIRRLFGPGAELSLSALFKKTPRGRELEASVTSLNTALAQLKGQTVQEITATLRAPGSYVLTLKTAGCQLAVRFAQDEVRVESLEVDLK